MKWYLPIYRNLFSVLVFIASLYTPIISVGDNAHDSREYHLPARLIFRRLNDILQKDLPGNTSPFSQILQDKNGLIWLAGEEGLIRFDGHDFKQYVSGSAANQLAGNIVKCMVLDNDDRLWVGTTSGLSLYRQETDDFINYLADEQDSNSLPDNYISVLHIIANNKLAVGTYNGLGLFDIETGRSINFHHDPANRESLSSNRIYSLREDENSKTLWVGTEYGLDGLHLGSLNVEPYDEIKKIGLPEKLYIRSIIFDHKDNMWLGTYGSGVIRIDFKKRAVTNFKYDFNQSDSLGNNTVWNIYQDTNHNIWVATDHGGLNLFDPRTEGFVHFKQSYYNNNSISSDQTRYIYEDKDNILWVSTYSGGINLIDFNNTHAVTKFTHEPDNANSLSHSSVLTIKGDEDGTVWVGTEGGLNAFNPKDQSFKQFVHTHDNPDEIHADPILSLEIKDRDYLWVGTWSEGLHLLNKNTEEFINYYPDHSDPRSISSAYIWDLLYDKNHHLWLGTETGGVDLYNSDTNNFSNLVRLYENSSIRENDFISDIIEDREGNLWFATLKGLHFLDVRHGQFRQYESDKDDSSTLSSNRVITLMQHSSGDLWVATEDKGISVLDHKTGSFSHISQAQGLPSQSVSILLEDNNNNVWVGTTRGLAYIDSTDQSIHVIGEKDGVVEDQFDRNASFIDKDGLLYFGGLGGLTVINPLKFAIKKEVVKTILTNFFINHEVVTSGLDSSPLEKPIYNTEDIVLSHRQNAFSFTFSSLNYMHPTSVNYEYRLIGYDNKWHLGNQKNYANYTNLNAGDYIFEARVQGGYSVLSNQSARVKIRINKAPWLTGWAYSFYLLVLLILLFMIFSYFRLYIKSKVYIELSTTDPLTQLYNRYGLEKIVEGYFKNRGAQSNLSLIVLDIDHFKQINDRYGHAVGDKILVEFSNRLKNTLRIGDSIVRWGGEEFVVLLNRTTAQSAYILAEKLRSTIEKHIFLVEDQVLEVTTSIGVAHCKEHESFEDLFKRADEALYKAKTTGRNTVLVAS